MHFQQLLSFVTVADERNFTRAAARLHLAQPSLSKQIHNLERTLSAQLFDRQTGGVRITTAGEALLPYARRILAEAEEAERAIEDLVGLRAGRVRVGSLPSLCTTVLADSLREFHSDFPAIQLLVQEAGSRQLVQQLDASTLDLAIIVLPLLRDDPALTVRPLLTEALVVAVARDDHSFAKPTVTVGDLRGHPLVMFRDGYDLRTTTVRACQAAGFEPDFSVEGGDMDAVLSFVESGLGPAVVPALALRGRPGLRAVAFDPPELNRTIALAHLRDVQLSRAARQFHAQVVQTAAELGFDPGPWRQHR
jgi:DNA-binding transcriptional LysR family regulator